MRNRTILSFSVPRFRLNFEIVYIFHPSHFSWKFLEDRKTSESVINHRSNWYYIQSVCPISIRACVALSKFWKGSKFNKCESKYGIFLIELEHPKWVLNFDRIASIQWTSKFSFKSGISMISFAYSEHSELRQTVYPVGMRLNIDKAWIVIPISSQSETCKHFSRSISSHPINPPRKQLNRLHHKIQLKAIPPRLSAISSFMPSKWWLNFPSRTQANNESFQHKTELSEKKMFFTNLRDTSEWEKRDYFHKKTDSANRKNMTTSDENLKIDRKSCYWKD